MAELIKCDKCGAIVAKNTYAYAVIDVGDEYFDLCNRCYKAVLYFIKRKDNAPCNDQIKPNTT